MTSSSNGIALGAALALALAIAPARAEPAAGLGLGTYTCGEAAEAVRADPDLDLLYFSWAQGWMTGWNLAQMGADLPAVDLNGRSLPTQRGFIKNYCAQHPDRLYMDAVRALYLSMKSGER